MSELYTVYILSSNVRTCFFYLNDSDLENFTRRGCSIKIQFGPDHKNITYGSVSLSSVSVLPPKYIGVAPLFASKLGLKENEIVLLSHCSVDSVSSLQVIPEKEEDYVILLSCKSLLEANLLSQVSVVSEGQIIPLYVFSNIPITVQIQNLNLQSGYGHLEKFTEVMVLYSSEKSKSQIKTENENDLGNQNKKKQLSLYSQIFTQLSNTLDSRKNPKQIESQKTAELFLKHVVEQNSSESIEYKIKPSLFLDESLQNIKNKFIIISNFECAINNFGPHCLKFLAQIEKVTTSNDKDEKGRSENDNKVKQDSVLCTYVVSLNNDENYTVFCPSEVMAKLNLFVGSKIRVRQVKSSSKLNVTYFSENIERDGKALECFSERTAALREKIRLTILNNFKYCYNINTLIIGGAGTGKTFFLKDIVNEFSREFVFCNFMHCKSLRGKKVDSLQKILIEHLKDCANQEPSLLVLDDLHALTYVDEEEGQLNKLYSDCVVDLLTDILEKFQTKCNITVIASAINLPQLSSVVSRHGPRLFQDVLTIPEMNLRERNFSLKFILNRKPNISVDSFIDLNKLSASTNGYTLQDLNDLVDKAIFNCCLRNETDANFSSISQEDFDLALSQSTPLNLKNVKLKQNIETKWENVGGMLEPKKVLTEVFSWPLKYPSVLESCPLRLQRGVLLYGAPGTGKTILAGALANKCGLNFISVKGPEVLSKYVGASEEGVRNLFVQAEKTQPCLLFFDEFDSLAPKRGHDNTGVTDRVVNQLLTQLDGVEALNGVWVLAATSRPDLLDPALLRPGRLDKMVFCDVPDQEDRLSILEVLSQNLSKCDDVRLLEIAKKTDGYTGADLQAILYNAQMCAIKEEKNSLGKKSVVKLKQIHFLKALTDVKPSLSQREKARYQTIYEKFLNSRMRKVEANVQESQRVTLA